ncbi:MAG: PD-(D/E)XK nuclease family protein [Marinirhabdus sp.]|nr:PD-(D/E)XK nuclease family protein [Marinirhabdus sp.]
MISFLEETLQHIQKKEESLSDAIFILPSKRAGGFLKNYIRQTATSAQFLPKIISIEDLIQELSGLEIIDHTELLFRSYNVYMQTKSFKEKESFDDFSAWAVTLLNDFNEVDRYLIDSQSFFDYLGSIKTLERWNVTHQQTKFIESYIAFWNSLPEFYNTLSQNLLEDGIGYQGLVYREAVNALEHYLASHGAQQHYFIGFNALNTAEQQIIQGFLETGNAEVFWDAEAVLVADEHHSASLFFRRYMKEWKYYQEHTPKFISNYFSEPKRIQIVSCQKNMAQIKYVGQLLASYSQEKLNASAIVLADEALLSPLLHSLPENVTKVNVTMGSALKNFPIAVFFETWFSLQSKPSKSLYYKDILALLVQPVAAKLLKSRQVIQKISERNTSHFSIETLQKIADPNDHGMLSLLFSKTDNATSALLVCQEILQRLKNVADKQSIENVVLFELHGVFNDLQNLNQTFALISTLSGLEQLFLELIATATIDFRGEAFSGLQIMGVLETRVLDFENIIVLSVNEGVFPAGKSNASFITYDLKKQFNLPLFTEKDAIYTYHFYHMLHRAKDITLCYTDFTEGINSGEKSRFLLQLEIEGQPQHTITHLQVAPSVSLVQKELQCVEKTSSLMQRIEAIAAKGFSPSALTSYIRNPIEFYYQKVLRISEEASVEETVAYNTLGTVVHNALQNLYTPFIGSNLTEKDILGMQGLISKEVAQQFSNEFVGGDITKGKNLIIFEVAKRYVKNAIALDLSSLKQGDSIKLLKVESDLKMNLSIPELPFPVYIHGQVDRVDEYNGTLRIIDYKTGMVQKGELEIMDWETLRTDYKYSKAFQVLTYALMMQDETNFETSQGGIISFKNMGSGFMPFATKESARGTKDQQITAETLQIFLEQLKLLILEICDPDKPLIEKEID